MKKRIRLLFIPALAVLLMLQGCASSRSSPPEEEGLLVLASFSTMADFAAKIAGERASVATLAPPGAEPHDWEPTAKDIASLEQADILVINGAGFEHWVGGVLPTLSNQALLLVDTSADIELLENSDEDDHEGHGHAIDPHIWLDPLSAARQMEAIAAALAERDPENAGYYSENMERNRLLCEALDRDYQDTLSGLPHREIVVTHESFGYLCRRYGLRQIAAQGLSPDGEPSPARMAEVIAQAADNHVPVIFFERAASPKVAEAIARETGAITDVLDPLEDLDPRQTGADYFSVMRENLAALERALQ